MVTPTGLDCPPGTLVIVSWSGPKTEWILSQPRQLGVGVYLGPHTPEDPDWENLPRIDMLWEGRVATFEIATGIWNFTRLELDNRATLIESVV